MFHVLATDPFRETHTTLTEVVNHALDAACRAAWRASRFSTTVARKPAQPWLLRLLNASEANQSQSTTSRSNTTLYRKYLFFDGCTHIHYCWP